MEPEDVVLCSEESRSVPVQSQINPVLIQTS
jgi:hypothetical protein